NHWKDNSGKLWMLGGWNINNGRYYNDLWRFNPSNNRWTWMSGSNIFNSLGIYGTQCVSSTANIPESRGENRAYATDQNGNFWILGGVGQSLSGNDLMMYCVSDNKWTWVSGNNPGFA